MKTCEVCGKELTGSQKRFCSHECRDSSTELNVPCECKNCGKTFHVKPWELRRGRGNYCGHACYYESMKGQQRTPKVKPTMVNCAWCGKEFATGGRGRPRLGSKFCSRACQAFGRVKTHHAKQMTVAQAAYLAGLIDGEGCIVAIDRKTGGRTTWRLQITSTTPEIVDWCLETTGVGTIRRKVSTNPKWADTLDWQCYAWNAKDVLEQCLPYMVLKRDKAQRAIDELANIERIAEG